ncbi:MAG: SPASM domain-containing protein [Comamonadaceae bacterium]|nr:SPASM domain-containing protein [Comamonadaceae bacterium]
MRAWLEHNGDLYCCDHFVEPKHLLGNIMKTPMIELVASQSNAASARTSWIAFPAIAEECDVRFVCNGECPKDRFMTTPDSEPGLNYLCAGFKQFFKHADPAMRVMANMLRQGRQAGEIMQLNTPQKEPMCTITQRPRWAAMILAHAGAERSLSTVTAAQEPTPVIRPRKEMTRANETNDMRARLRERRT